jgi:hypothetical protein
VLFRSATFQLPDGKWISLREVVELWINHFAPSKPENASPSSEPPFGSVLVEGDPELSDAIKPENASPTDPGPPNAGAPVFSADAWSDYPPVMAFLTTAEADFNVRLSQAACNEDVQLKGKREISDRDRAPIPSDYFVSTRILFRNRVRFTHSQMRMMRQRYLLLRCRARSRVTYGATWSRIGIF